MALNVILGLIMFGVALDMTPEDFTRVAKKPRGVVVGLIGQLLLLPAMTFALSMVLTDTPSVALGMIMVAACPGGNMSNFFTYLARGDLGVSVTMTSICTVLAVLTTPFNLTFWGSLRPETAALIQEVSLDPVQMVLIVALVLALPLALGMLTAHRFPAVAKKAQGPFKILSLVVFMAFIVLALRNNWHHFLNHIHVIFGLVLLHNAMAMTLGYSIGALAKLPERQRRSLTIEIGIQNSGLGLVLIFTFFNGLGGMAVIAAWWGVWHMVSGLIAASFWARRPALDEEGDAAAAQA